MSSPTEGAAGGLRQGIAGRQSFRDVWFISTGHGLTHWYPATFYLILPLVGTELGLSYGRIGLIMTCQFVIGAITNIPGGLIVDAIGRRARMMAISLFWVGMPYLLMRYAHSYWPLLVCVALVGIGNNLWHPAAILSLSRSHPEQRGLVLSLHSMGANVGDALAPLAVGWMLTRLDWRDVVTINIVPGVLMAAVILFAIGDDRATDAGTADPRGGDPRSGKSAGWRRHLVDLGAVLRDRSVAMLSLGSAFRTMTQSALVTFLPVYLAGEMGLSTVWVGTAMFLLQACGFVAAPIAGHLSDRVGRRQIILGSMVMTAVVLLAMAIAGRSPAFVALIALLGFFLYAVRSIMQAWLLDLVPVRNAGTGVGILFGAQAVGAAIGPALTGLIADRHGLMAAFYFLAASIVIANFFVFFTRTGGSGSPQSGG